jgi:hypothetical protein
MGKAPQTAGLSTLSGNRASSAAKDVRTRVRTSHGQRPPITAAVTWGGANVTTTDAIAEAVDMRGGEYFFMPSLAFLRSL